MLPKIAKDIINNSIDIVGIPFDNISGEISRSPSGKKLFVISVGKSK